MHITPIKPAFAYDQHYDPRLPTRPDARHDLSLRLLALFVTVALIVSLASLLTGILRSSLPDTGTHGRARVHTPLIVEESVTLAAREAVGLIVYRCDEAGRITYADRPCSAGVSRTLRLPPT